MLYLLPYSYGIATRVKGLLHKISFLIVIMFPIFYLSNISSNDNTLLFIAKFILGFTALYSIYEIGYIYNDVITTRFEKNPTFRLDEKKQLEVERLANLLISFRVCYATISIVLLNITNALNIEYFIILLILLHLSYAFHNYFRNKINILTILFVLIFKYISVPILFIPLEQFSPFIIMLILIVPLLRTIEFCGKPKYKIRIISNFNYDKFRVSYYFILITLGLILTYVDDSYRPLITLSIIFFIYRLLVFITLNNKGFSNYVRKIRKV
jgi:hypothetical protein